MVYFMEHSIKAIHEKEQAAAGGGGGTSPARTRSGSPSSRTSSRICLAPLKGG